MEVRKKVEIMSGPVRKNKFNTGKNTHLLPNTYIFFIFFMKSKVPSSHSYNPPEADMSLRMYRLYALFICSRKMKVKTVCGPRRA